jgi:rRNA-processing protein FCF1
MKVMIDTNIIISAALSPNGNAAKAFMKAVLPPYEPVVCDYIVDELHRKFQEKFPRKTTELEAFLYNAMQVIKTVPTPDNEVDDEGISSSSRSRSICSTVTLILPPPKSIVHTNLLVSIPQPVTCKKWRVRCAPRRTLCQLKV